jgi:phosphatidylglycerophosphate synthase
MTPLQKTAWIEAGLWIAATLLFLALLFQVGPKPAQAAFALIGLLPFAGYLVNRRCGARGFHPVLDERDQEIYLRAGRHSLATSYVVFVLGITGLQLYALRAGDCVPASVLMAVFWLAVALQALVRAASVIAQSRSQEAADRG